MSGSAWRRAHSSWAAPLRRQLVCASFAFVCAGFTFNASAQPPTEVAAPEALETPSLEQARSLFAEAAALEGRQHWLEAAEKLREVLAIRETSGVRFHLAYCLENQGALVAALENYRRAARLNEADLAEDVAALLEPALERLTLRVPRLTVEVGAPAAELAIDGEAYLPNEALQLDPGPHIVEVAAPGFIPTRRKVTLSEAERRTFLVELDPLPPRRELAPEPLAATPERSSSRTAVVVTGVSVVATAGAAAALTVARNRAARRVDDGRVALEERGATAADCADPRTVEVERACWQIGAYGSDRYRARVWQTVSLAATGVGLVAFASAYVGWRGARKRRQSQGMGSPPRVRIAGHPGRSGHLVVSAQF